MQGETYGGVVIKPGAKSGTTANTGGKPGEFRQSELFGSVLGLTTTEQRTGTSRVSFALSAVYAPDAKLS